MSLSRLTPHFRTFSVLSAISLSVAVTPVHAQFDGSAYAFPVPDYVSGGIANSTMSNVYRSGKSKSSKSASSKSKRSRTTPVVAKTASPAQRNKLFFTPSASVTQKSNLQFVNHLDGQLMSSRQQIEKAVNGGEFRRMYSKIIGPSQLSGNNVADVLSAYMVVSWGILNDKPNVGRPLDRAGTRAVQSSLRNQLALDRKFQILSSEQKQLFSEQLANLTVLYVMQNAEFRKTRNQASLKRLKDQVRTVSRQRLGVDLSKVRFTSQGFDA